MNVAVEMLAQALTILQQAAALDLSGDTDAALELYGSAKSLLDALAPYLPRAHADVVQLNSDETKRRVDAIRRDRLSREHRSNFPTFPITYTPLPPPPLSLEAGDVCVPACPTRRVYWLMRRLLRSMRQGGFLAPDLFVARDVWYQDGAAAAVANTGAKLRFLRALCAQMERLRGSASDGNWAGDAAESARALRVFLEAASALAAAFAEETKMSPRSGKGSSKGVRGLLQRGQRVLRTWRGQEANYELCVVWAVNALEQAQMFERWMEQLTMTQEQSTGHAETLELLHRITALLYSGLCTFLLHDMAVLVERYQHKCRKSITRLFPVDNVMPKTHLTLDAAYKFTLWYELFTDARHRRAQNEIPIPIDSNKEPPKHCADTEDRRRAHVLFFATSLLRASLPRRVLRSCCLTGACGRTASLTHKSLRFGRGEVSLMGPRDDMCACVADAAATVGRPLRLALHAYHTGARDDKDDDDDDDDSDGPDESESRGTHANAQGSTARRGTGLRCLLRHSNLVSLDVDSIADPRDTHSVVREVAAVLRRPVHSPLRPPLRRLSLRAMRIGSTGTLPLLLRACAHAVLLEELRVEECGEIAVADFATVVAAAASLRVLSLRGNSLARAHTGLVALAEAIAGNPSLTRVDLSLCALRDEDLCVFLSHTCAFTARASGFALDVAGNAFTIDALTALAAAPQPLRNTLDSLDLRGHYLFGRGTRPLGNALAHLLEHCAALTWLALDDCAVAPRDVSRLCRALASHVPLRGLSLGSGGGLSLSHGAELGAAELRRLLSAPLAPGAALCLRSWSIGPAGLQRAAPTWPALSRLAALDLSRCALCDAGFELLAVALSRAAAPLPLRALRLDANGADGRGGGLLRLGRALRQAHAPRLACLSLADNRLADNRSALATLVEQASETLGELRLAHTAIAADESAMADLFARIARRQQGRAAGAPFAALNVYAAGATPGVEAIAWLETQSAVQFYA